MPDPAPENVIRHEVGLIRTAIGVALSEKNIPPAPQWTQLTPDSLDRIEAALDALTTERDALKTALEEKEYRSSSFRHRDNC